MEKGDVSSYLSGCGCWLIPIALIALPIIFGRGKSHVMDKAMAIKDSVEDVIKVDSLSSVKNGMDYVEKVIIREGDSLFHYYTNCNKMSTSPKYKIIRRVKAIEMGLKTCPDCMDIEDYYMGKIGLGRLSEKHIEFMKRVYSRPAK